MAAPPRDHALDDTSTVVSLDHCETTNKCRPISGVLYDVGQSVSKVRSVSGPFALVL